jgi:hypothetical protein
LEGGGAATPVALITAQLQSAGVPLPAPSHINRWIKSIGLYPLQHLLASLIAADLAGKKRPDAYIHKCVMDRADRAHQAHQAHRANTASTLRRRPLPPAMATGSDAQRQAQARRLAAAARKGRP